MKSKKDFKYEYDYKEYLRLYFAGLAMQGLMTSQNQDGEWKHDLHSCAEISVRMSDELLKQLDK